MLLSFKLPDIGEGVHEGEVVAWHVKPGDAIVEDAPLLDVMTDKVTAEIPSPLTGIIQTIMAEVGQVVAVGSVIVTIEATPNPESNLQQPFKLSVGMDSPPVAKSTRDDVINNLAEATNTVPSQVLAAPATRQLAQTLQVDLASVAGTGVNGRITPKDVSDYANKATAITIADKDLPTIKPTSESCPLTNTGDKSLQKKEHQSNVLAHSDNEGDQRVPFSGIRKKIADHLSLSKHKVPHFGYVEEADLTELVTLRNSLKKLAHHQGVTLTYLPFFIKAVVAGLKAFPVLNATLDERSQELVYQSHYNIGLAMATTAGLVVPVIHNADKLSIVALAKQIALLADQAKHNKLTLTNLKGGTFTISSIGSIGGMIGLPIINYPEVGILCINKIEKRPVVRPDAHEQDTIVIRQMSYLSMACDHRVVDGAETAHFLAHVIGILEQPNRLLLEV
jgi:pyruvate/2-oxoglutarate dehydrogenase complex dihydrolipoamide acyltransferase (E2) component